MYKGEDSLSNLDPAERPTGAESAGGQTNESDDLRSMIESMRDEFTRKLDHC